MRRTILSALIVTAALFSLSTGCAVRRLPPVKYLPVLGKKADASMEGILKEALRDRNKLVRQDAVRLLGTMIATPEEQQRSAAALGNALNDDEEHIRMEAVRSLGNIPVEISGPYLRKAMTDESIRVRIQVVQVLREAYQRQSGQLQSLAGGP